MKGIIRIANPEAIEAEVTLRAPLREWKELREQLGERYPSWALSSILRDLVNVIEARASAETESAP